MKLYRARPVSQRPQRQPPYLGKAPEHRVRGRWYTSDMEAAKTHGEDNLAGEEWEIVVVEVTDEFAESFRVAGTPKTKCGLSPIDFAVDPETEYIIGANGKIRERDYLFRTQRSMPNPSKSEMVHEIAKKLDIPVIDIKIAA